MIGSPLYHATPLTEHVFPASVAPSLSTAFSAPETCATGPFQFRSNLAAASWRLPEDDFQALSDLDTQCRCLQLGACARLKRCLPRPATPRLACSCGLRGGAPCCRGRCPAMASVPGRAPTIHKVSAPSPTLPCWAPQDVGRRLVPVPGGALLHAGGAGRGARTMLPRSNSHMRGSEKQQHCSCRLSLRGASLAGSKLACCIHAFVGVACE